MIADRNFELGGLKAIDYLVREIRKDRIWNGEVPEPEGFGKREVALVRQPVCQCVGFKCSIVEHRLHKELIVDVLIQAKRT